ncbi:MAG: AI-2E family transporter [Erysipelotrichaceae bacterium]|jgi:predicted PurR-regulated permease PerM|nr:AI-2E family transporter [Erysipelotrichaceae bacterium]MBQ1303526.1 AI-2E family transporter [Erysipelotrichaceae bacterium]MBQ1757098.1 AI-2E family transporter [Erysipelotrichaceae bacterium]MBR3351260.1 AI-2E family transporter [Erysipelotrichaceae bacterium]
MNDELRNFTKRILIVCAVLLIGVIVVLERSVILGAVVKVINATSSLLLGFIIAFVLNIPMKKLEKLFARKIDPEKKKLIRTLAIITTYVSALLIIVLLISIIVPQLINSVTMLAANLPQYIVTVLEFLNGLFDKLGLSIHFSTDLIGNDFISGLTELIKGLIPAGSTESFLEWLASLDLGIFSDIGTGAAKVFSVLFDIFMGIVFSIYLLISKETFKQQVINISRAFMSEKMYDVLYYLYHKVNTIFTDFAAGQLTEMAILGSLFFVVLSIAGMPYALLISVFIALTSIIPYFGTTIAMIFGAILIFAETSVLRMIIFIVLFVIVQQIEDNIIYPNVVGNSVGLSAIWVIAAVTIFGSLFGLGGMVFGVPAMAVIQSVVKDIERYRLDNKV